MKCTLSREESLLIHPKRHPIRMEYWAGCDADGRLTALRARMVGDSGPYASVGMKVLERAAGHASGPYHVPAIDVEAVAVRTNNPVCGAFRGFGANQAQFAMEGVHGPPGRAGRASSAGRSGSATSSGPAWCGARARSWTTGAAGAERCLEAVKPAYDAAVAAGKAVGLGLGLKNSGLGNGFKEVARAVVRFEPDGTVEVRHCWTEMGQGVHTVALQVAVEELGIDPARVRVVVDTSRELGCGQTTGSRGTLMGAGAVADACRAADAGGCRTGRRLRRASTASTGPTRSARGWPTRSSTPPSATPPSSSSSTARPAAIERVVAVHDVGRAVNPLLCEGQIEGAVHMGLGYALSEDFPVRRTTAGRPT